jgi:hypothetical protein
VALTYSPGTHTVQSAHCALFVVFENEPSSHVAHSRSLVAVPLADTYDPASHTRHSAHVALLLPVEK